MTAEPRIIALTLDDARIIRRTPEVEHERAVAIADLLEGNHFSAPAAGQGPYSVFLSVVDDRMSFLVRCEGAGEHLIRLPLKPFRGIIRDYFMLCESYFDAIKHAPPDRIQTIDMARRALHNEGSDTLIFLLKDKAEIDFDTARRLFTLICVLHIR